MQPKDVYDFHAWFNGKFAGVLGVRASTFYQALMLAVARNAKTIVETGTLRIAGNWGGDGQSTRLLAEFAQRYDCRLWTCDLDPAAIAVAREETAPFAARIEYVVGDSVAFLQQFPQPIDLLLLDSKDFDPDDPDPSQDHAVREAQAALPRLHMQSIVLIDDCGLKHGGKGGKVIPFLLGQGWQAVGLNYQVLLTHTFDSMGKTVPHTLFAE